MLVFRCGLWLLGALLSFSSTVHSLDADPNEDFCSLSGHMMAQKGGMLYIIGGWMQYISAYEDHNGGNPILRTLDVSKSFRTSVDGVNYIRIQKDLDTIPGVTDAAFFPTEWGFDLTFGLWRSYNSTIYGKKGAPIEDKKWEYNIDNDDWVNKDITLRDWFQPNSPRRVGSSMTVWIESLKKGFLFGGAFVSVNETSLSARELEEHNGLITYDRAADTWTNESTSLGGIAEGGLVHIETFTDDVLIQIGGRSDLATRLRPFSDINIYSTRKSKWYTQHLPPGAVVPAPRFAFCTAVKPASDGSSYQIYIMGGLEASPQGNIKGGPTATSIWVLSIPSFQWVELSPGSSIGAADPQGRIAPRCQAIGQHYIFYYGGRKSRGYGDTVMCDKNANAAFLFDINTLEWTDEFKPKDGRYEIPQKVTGLIGGGKSGGSTKKAPAGGWSDPDLKNIMTLESTSTTGGSSVGTSTGSSPGPSKTNAGAIAGGIIAGVVGVALGLLGAMTLLRHLQRRRRQPTINPIIRPRTIIAGTIGGGGGPTELMAHTEDLESPSELPAGEVASEMDSEHGNWRV